MDILSPFRKSWNQQKNISTSITLSAEFKSISELKKLLGADCKIEKINPPVFASDAEVNIVTVTLVCPDGKIQTIRAYGEEAQLLREFIRSHTLK
jgi:hypothetical protein